MFKKFAAICLAAVMGASSFVGSAQAADKPVVGLVMKSLANEFFKNMVEGAEAFAKKDGSFKLIPVGMNSETDFQTQVNAVENFITRKVDVIVMAPADSALMARSAKKAIDAGIVVINFDVTLDKKALVKAGLPENFLFVGPDNADGAEMVGNYLGDTIGKGAKVIIVEGNPGADNAKQRKEGFMRSVKKYDFDLLASRTAHWETEEANTLMTNLLVKYPDVQGVMCANDSMVIGVQKALQAAGRNDVKIVGFDAIAPVVELIKQGKVLATIDQFGQDLASAGIKAGLKLLKEGKVGPDNIPTGWEKTPIELVK